MDNVYEPYTTTVVNGLWCSNYKLNLSLATQSVRCNTTMPLRTNAIQWRLASYV